jgi:hypothetical protein
MSKIKVSDYCAIDGKPGQIRYIKEDGPYTWYGVSLLNEGERVDEWQACQIQVLTPSEGGRLAAKWMAENKK